MIINSERITHQLVPASFLGLYPSIEYLLEQDGLKQGGEADNAYKCLAAATAVRELYHLNELVMDDPSHGTESEASGPGIEGDLPSFGRASTCPSM